MIFDECGSNFGLVIRVWTSIQPCFPLFLLCSITENSVGLVDKYDIDPVNLNIEITETTLMSDFDKNMGIIRLLQNYGFNIEIDDFGSGYSSLNMLKDISADVLKIDMGFLRASENEAKGLDILESIITLAGKLGMKVITEGVETKKQLTIRSCYKKQYINRFTI